MANNYPTIRPSLNINFAGMGVLPPDVTFTRASQSGGYYDGRTVVKAEENLLLQSQALNEAVWNKNGSTITANTAVAPDGTTTADKIAETATTAIHNVNQLATLQAAVYTRSTFVKAAERLFALISDGTNHAVSVDLTTGVATSAVGSPSNITSVESPSGSGWWRVSWSYTAAAGAGNLNVYSSADGVWANRSFAGVDGSGILAWGDQLEQRSTVTAYTPTTTAPITNYIPRMLFAAANVPVFDHNPVTGEALGLSVWEARTNLLLRSQEFDDAYWTKTAATARANQIIAPDGALTADNFIPDSGSAAGSSILERTITAAAAAYTVSIFVKAAGFNSVILNFRDNATVANQASVTFDISAATISTAASVQGSFTSPVATITNVGNGWRRITLTCTTTGATAFRVRLWQAVSAGDGVSGIYIWGAQLEAGAFATPYIPTVASTVARSADVAVMTGANFSRWFNPAQGTFVVNSTGLDTSFTVALQIDDGTTSNRIAMIMPRASSASPAFIAAGGATQTAFSNATFVGDDKEALSYAANNVLVSVNGAAVQTDTTVVLPVVDRLRIRNNSVSPSSGYVKSIAYYPQTLTAAQLQAVTA